MVSTRNRNSIRLNLHGWINELKKIVKYYKDMASAGTLVPLPVSFLRAIKMGGGGDVSRGFERRSVGEHKLIYCGRETRINFTIVMVMRFVFFFFRLHPVDRLWEKKIERN